MKHAHATLNGFLETISAYPDAMLVFTAEGETIRADYHVTELKRAHVNSIDCGGNESDWTETIVQLLDGQVESNGEHMSVSKFVKIAALGNDKLRGLGEGELSFEFGAGNQQMLRYAPLVSQAGNDKIVVELQPVRAACKPAQSWFEPTTNGETVASCCGGKSSTAGGEACCAT